MVYLILYLVGSLVSLIWMLKIIKEVEGVLTIKDLLSVILISIASWLSVFIIIKEELKSEGVVDKMLEKIDNWLNKEIYKFDKK